MNPADFKASDSKVPDDTQGLADRVEETMKIGRGKVSGSGLSRNSSDYVTDYIYNP